MATRRFPILIFMLLAAFAMASSVMLPQVHGMPMASQDQGDQCEQAPCCGTETESNPPMQTGEEPAATCCPSPDQPEECPCKCPCCGSNARTTLNLLPAPLPGGPVFTEEPQTFQPPADTLPSSASLGVDVRPPIA